MATKAEISTVYAAGLVQGIALHHFGGGRALIIICGMPPAPPRQTIEAWPSAMASFSLAAVPAMA